MRYFALIICVAAFAVFSPSLRGEFLSWDDTDNFIVNTAWRGLSFAHLKWMFSTLYSTHYLPLTWISLALDYKLWGLNPMGFHLTALLLHCCNSVLVCLLLRELLRANGSGDANRLALASFFGALFFSLHPLRAESVCWITARRDLTSGFFSLLMLLFYIKAAGETGPRRRNRALSIIFFACAILSRELTAALVSVLFLLDIYPLRRLNPRFWRWHEKPGRDILIEKLPYIALAGFGAVMAVTASMHYDSMEKSFPTSWTKYAQAAAGLAFYLRKTLCPFGLSPIYEVETTVSLQAVVCNLLWVSIPFGTAFVLRKKLPSIAAALAACWLLVFPTLGFTTRISYAYDRYSYLSCLGFAGLFAGAVYYCLGRWKAETVKMAAAIPLCLLGILSFTQAGIWVNPERLWQHAVAVHPGPVAYRNSSVALADSGQFPQALAACDAALKSLPDDYGLWSNRAIALLALGRNQEALDSFQKAIALSPANYQFHLGAARASYALGLPEQAAAEYSFCLTHVMSGQQRFEILSARGGAYFKNRHYDLALADFAAAAALAPTAPQPLKNMALASLSVQDYNRALLYYSEAIRRDPSYAPAYNGRASVLEKTGRKTEAAADRKKAAYLAAALQ